MTTPPASDAARLRVVLVSGAYGYSGRLMYFASIFREFARHFPLGTVFVDEAFDVAAHPGLPLTAAFRSTVHRRPARGMAGGYRRVLRLPSPRNLGVMVRYSPDVYVVIETTATACLGILAARLTRRALVVMVESDPSYRNKASQGRKAAVVKRVKKALLSTADVVLVSNEIGRRYLVDGLGVSPELIRVGPYLTSAPAAPTPLPPAPPARLLFVNSLTDRKGVGQLLSALAAIDDLDWRLDIVGDGDQRAALEAQAADSGLHDRIVFHGRVDFEDLAPFFARNAVVVCPSLADYRSLGGFEAVNAGRVVLLSRRDGAHVELSTLADGVVVSDPLDPADLRAGLRRAIEMASGPAPVPAFEFSVQAAGENVRDAVLEAYRRRRARRSRTR